MIIMPCLAFETFKIKEKGRQAGEMDLEGRWTCT